MAVFKWLVVIIVSFIKTALKDFVRFKHFLLENTRIHLHQIVNTMLMNRNGS